MLGRVLSHIVGTKYPIENPCSMSSFCKSIIKPGNQASKYAMEMHSMVSLVRKLGKALLLRFDEVHDVDGDHKVRYKEARGPILILSFFFLSLYPLRKRNPKYSQWFLTRSLCGPVFIHLSPLNSHQRLKGSLSFSHKSNLGSQSHTKRLVIFISNLVSLQ
jgi:hypothetical protein